MSLTPGHGGPSYRSGMSPTAAFASTVGLVVLALLLGWAWRSRSGRVHRAARPGPDLGRLLQFSTSAGTTAARAGDRATLVQFSAELCSSCGPTRRVLGRIAASHPGVAHVEVSLTEHPELAGELQLLQTPTTLLFDTGGTQRARIGGAPRVAQLREELADLLKEHDVANA